MSIKNIGIIVSHLDDSQHGYLLCDNMNNLLSHYYNYHPVIFYQIPSFPNFPIHCACLQQQHIWGFDGILIATNLITAQILTKCITTAKKLFYIYDLEWIYKTNIPYAMLKNIYQNPELNLIVQTQTHFDIVSKCWKIPIGICENYNYEELIKIVNMEKFK